MLMMLGFEIFSQLQRLPVKPPVTIAFLGINIGIHLDPSMLGYNNSIFNWIRGALVGHGRGIIADNCLSLGHVSSYYNRWQTLPWNRVFLSGLIHADDRHLYYNMLSFLYKGIYLEQSMGSVAFLTLVMYSWAASALCYLALNMLYGDGYSCAVGFSAVIFALKYVHNHRSPGRTSVWGISVPTRYAAWLELVVIQV